MSDALRYAIATDGLRLIHVVSAGPSEVVYLPAVRVGACVDDVSAGAQLSAVSTKAKLTTFKAVAKSNSACSFAEIKRVSNEYSAS